ncbi:MAG: CsgG/HfaB family protein [Desulfuromonadaceae bacterium]|nr:CsgG/HfaB family protein [Desulfuromonadaceae bacterium]
MKQTIIRYYLILSALIIISAPVLASDNSPVTVDVDGYAAIAGGNKAAARDDALKSAFRIAIEQVVGVMVKSKTVVSDSALLNDKIFSKSAGFIKTYKINSETFQGDECRVNVKATVSAVRLEKSLHDVGLLSKKMGKPRIAVIITEQNIGNDAPTGSLGDGSVNAGIADSVIHAVFEKKGYNLVDRDTLVALAKREGSLSSTGVIASSDAAIQVAAGGGAEVVIIGQAVAKAGASALSGTNMRTSDATVSVRAVDADTGQLIASESKNERSANVNPTAGGSEAIKKASQAVAEKLHQKIVAKWSSKVTGTRTARLVIKGIEFGGIRKFQDMLKEQIGHVEETFERGFKNGVLTLDAEINGNARELAEELTATGMEGYKFRIISFTGNTLNIQIQKK